MKIAIGSDHAGFRYKEKIKEMLRSAGHEVIDFGTDSEEPCDYPLFIRPVAEAVAHNEVERGVEALHIVNVWLETPFEGGRHTHRIYLIDHPEAAANS